MLPTWNETLHKEAGIIHPTLGQLIHHPPDDVLIDMSVVSSAVLFRQPVVHNGFKRLCFDACNRLRHT